MGSPVTITPDTSAVTITPDAPTPKANDEGFIHKAWRVINTPIADLAGQSGTTKRAILEAVGQKLGIDLSPENLAYQAQRTDTNHPAVQGLRTFLAGSANDAADVGASFTSPLALGTAAAGAATKIPGAVGAVAKAVTGGASAGFGLKGASDVIANAPAALSGNPDAAQKALMGGAMVAGGAAGVGSTAGPLVRRGLLLGKTPAEAYQSALKPSTTLGPQKTAAIVQTGLQNKIPVSQKGLTKLGELIAEVNDEMDAAIPANSPQTVNKFAIANRLNSVADSFKMQVNPNDDLAAVSKSGNEFLENQPGAIPVKDAAQIKSGTYRQIGSKAYGELSTAAKESQKALARGIKEELIVQFPELKDLGIRDQQLLNLQPELERAVNRIGNHQLMGIGTPVATGAAKALTGSSKIAAVAGVVKAVLDNPMVKSRLAIALSKSGVPYVNAIQRLNAYQSGLAAATLPAVSESAQYPAQSPDQ